MTDPRDDFSWRAATDGDVDALTVLLDAATRAHLGEPTNRTQVSERLATPGCTLAEDSVVVRNGDGDAIAFSQVWAAPPADVRAFSRVHPDWRGLGLGSALAAWARHRASAKASLMGQGSVRYSTTAWAGDRSASAVLRAAGLHEMRHFLRMVTELPSPRPPAPDVVIDAYVPGVDDAALWSAYCDSFAEHWGHEQPDEQGFWWDVRDAPAAGYDPTLWSVTRADGTITGLCLGRESERGGSPDGFVMIVGVRPAWRSNRIGHALLTHTLGQFEERGLNQASLNVDADNVTDALRLYRSVGMTAEPSFTIWGTHL